MTFPELDQEIKTIVANTITGCGGTPDGATVDLCATVIENLAAANVGELNAVDDAPYTVTMVWWYWGAVKLLSTVRFGSVRNEATERVYAYCKYQMDRHALKGMEALTPGNEL